MTSVFTLSVFSFLLKRRLPKSTLFPYTTLFRSETYDNLFLQGNAVANYFFFVDDRKRLRSDRKSTRLNSSHANISYAVFCLKKKNEKFYHTILAKNNTCTYFVRVKKLS